MLCLCEYFKKERAMFPLEIIFFINAVFQARSEDPPLSQQSETQNIVEHGGEDVMLMTSLSFSYSTG